MVAELQKAHVRRAFVLWVTRSTKSCGGVFCCALAVSIDANSGVLMPTRGARSAT
jgi:hypothetical protein